MQEYDVTLKLILQDPAAQAAQALTGVKIERWLNVELPEVQQTRVDLLGETAEGGLVHIELQSSNDANMALRMLEYSVRVCRRFGRFPRQILVYVGEPAMRMSSAIEGERLRFSYDAIDIRDLDGEPLLASPHLSDNVIAILTRLRNRKAAVQQILTRIAEADREQREIALKGFLILAGLRGMEEYAGEKASQVPVLNDIMNHRLFGPAIRQGLERGREEGREEGREQEALAMLRRMMIKKFGSAPEWATALLANRSTTELEELSERLFDVKSVEELFGQYSPGA